MLRRLVLTAVALVALALSPGARAQEPLTVFAAASLTDAMRDLGAQWRARGNPAPRLSFAASSALARQIEQGAPADIFMSADERWMDYVQERNLIVNATRVSLLGNNLVREYSQVLDLYALNYGLGMGRFSFGTAINIFNSVVSVILLFTANGIFKRVTKESIM